MLTFLQRKQAGVLYIWRAQGGKMRDSEKVYSKEELLNYLYKYGNIPVILFAKDKEGKCRQRRSMESSILEFWKYRNYDCSFQ